jgi:hypothetical protein
MENEKTIFCGSGKQTHEMFLNLAICLSDIPKEHVNEFNGKKYVNITAVKKKEVDQYGKTHFVKINDFKPESQGAGAATDNSEDPGNLPF